MKYYVKGKEKLTGLGVYPVVSLLEARQQRMKLKQDLKAGIDIIKTKKEGIQKDKGVFAFKNIALEWHKNKKESLSEKYSKKITRRLERDIFPKLGNKDIREIT